MLSDYETFSQLTARIDRHIEAERFDAALRMIQKFVERIIDEPILVSQVFGSRELDQRCRQIGLACFRGLQTPERAAPSMSTECGPIVYVVTKLQVSGGHTKVVSDFIKAMPNKRHVILSTELVGASEVTSMHSGVGNDSLATFEAAPHGTHLERLRWVQTRLLELAPHQVYLFNHHQDSIAVAAVVPEIGATTTFYHHGDHHFCLGVFLSDAEHVDPHPMGFCNCREHLGIENQFVPLVVEDRPSIKPTSRHEGELTTCTAARSNKIEVPYYVNYLDVIPEMLSKTGGRHVHIGRLTPWALFRLHRGLRKFGVEKRRFVYVPWVPSVWDALHDYQVDLYIASFPYGGGLTLIEAMGAGVPVALHRHMHSAILSGLSLAYPGAFGWHDKGELISYCQSLTRAVLDAEAKRARAHYENFHRAEILSEILNARERSALHPDARADRSVRCDTEEWTTWISHSLTLRSILRNKSLRLLKKARRQLLRISAALPRVITACMGRR